MDGIHTASAYVVMRVILEEGLPGVKEEIGGIGGAEKPCEHRKRLHLAF
jgi:hypothetical protein